MSKIAVGSRVRRADHEGQVKGISPNRKYLTVLWDGSAFPDTILTSSVTPARIDPPPPPDDVRSFWAHTPNKIDTELINAKPVDVRRFSRALELDIAAYLLNIDHAELVEMIVNEWLSNNPVPLPDPRT
jgi:hypothetical protein